MILNIIDILEKDFRLLEKDVILYVLKKMELANTIYCRYDIETNKRIGDEKLNNEQIVELFLVICNWCKENNDIAALSTLLNFKEKRNLQEKRIEKKLEEIKKEILDI